MTSMCVLGLRPLSFLSEEELPKWGNDAIQTLIDHFGVEKSHEYKDAENNTQVTKSPPLVDAEQTKAEWLLLKQTVKTQVYPRTSTANLWELIMTYHKEDFQNLTKLAQLALAHPVHTADCERAFSAQNAITTPIRNRLSAENIDSLMRVAIEGGTMEGFDFKAALAKWKSNKARKIKI